MDINVNINHLSGTIDPISSKSTIHRSLICALLSRGIVRINKINFSKDVIATISILEKLNCKIKIVGNDIIIDSTNLKKYVGYLDCNESGSTLRFMIPVLLFLFNEAKVDGKYGLKKRPLDIYTNLFECDYNMLPIAFKGRLKAQEYIIDGNVSSQFVSGLLFVLPLLEEDSKISFKTPLESKQYVDLTIDVLKAFNINVFKKEDCIIIKGNQEYANNLVYENEVDESNLAFFKVANELGCKIKFSEFNQKTSQPDAIIDEIIATRPNIIDVSEFPDLLPILAVLCCFNEYETKLINASRTMIKESNRLV
ncbi:MAG: 3-phosphoshikimate 1-carboxyvinyltransferase, partial [Mycoplasmatales bacterium]